MEKSRGIRVVLILFIYFFTVLGVYAQHPIIKASIDSTQILIGQQTIIHLEIAANKNDELQLPVIQDTLVNGVEVLGISQPDTTNLGNNRIQIKYDYHITSFDSALYLIPPFKLITPQDTFYSNELALKVSTLPVDTSSKNIYDIKDVVKPPFVLADYLSILFYILIASLLILLLIYVIFRKKKQKPLLPIKKEKIVLPPHVLALKELDEIKSQKLWQKGKEKEYHSEISDTIRRYIEGRFSVYAMEMTSDQLLRTIRGVSDVDFVYDKLRQILLLADLVKFAKYHPLPEENELSLMNAYLFVNETKKEEIGVENEKK
ncbi:BatD family protein [Bacteroidales bacterium OttesenSCG-928-M06]|nr:BatD family protein [Bacteroidales bacterium OttesenSCG-928-M06]